MNNLYDQVTNLRRLLPSYISNETVLKIVSVAYGKQIEVNGEIKSDYPGYNSIPLPNERLDLPPFQQLQHVINMILNLKYTADLGKLSEMAPTLIAYMHGEEHFSAIENPLLPPTGMIDPHTEDETKLTAVKKYYGHPALVTSLFGFFYSEHTYLLGKSGSGKSRLIQNELTLTELKKRRVIVITGKVDKYEFIRSQGMHISCFESDQISELAIKELYGSDTNFSLLTVSDNGQGIQASDLLSLIIKYSSCIKQTGFVLDGLNLQFTRSIKDELMKLSELGINVCFCGAEFKKEIYENTGYVYLLKPTTTDIYPEPLSSMSKNTAYYDSSVIKKDIPFVSFERKTGQFFFQRYPLMPDEHFVNTAPSLFTRIFSRGSNKELN